MPNRPNAPTDPAQGQGQPRQNGGTVAGAAQHVQEQGEGLADRAREGLDQAKEQALHGYRQAERIVARNPGQAVLIGFGVGFGVGVLMTLALSGKEETWYERNVPKGLRDGIDDLPDRAQSAVDYARSKAEGIHLGDLTDRLRHAAEGLAKHLPESLRR